MLFKVERVCIRRKSKSNLLIQNIAFKQNMQWTGTITL